jgi:hypothetical protein
MGFIEVRNAETDEHVLINMSFIVLMEHAARGAFRIVVVLGNTTRSILVDAEDAARLKLAARPQEAGAAALQ